MTTPLHVLGEWIRQLLSQIPLPVVRAVFVAVPIAVLIWVWRLPAEAALPPQPTGRLDENLKVWASLALLIQIAIYLIF
ncbi:MAG: hypothetical protein KatS3mg105_3550 [Gemmatales bacterium]|nr:MAG: hypothetical protein KatS3mg105_3550 [Gemmatales bacterium]